MPFGEFGTVSAKNQRQMSIVWNIESQRFCKRMWRGVLGIWSSPYDMRHTHLIIVHDDGKMEKRGV